MTTNEHPDPRRRIRLLLRVSGAVLWVLALTGMYVVWQASRKVNERPVVSAGAVSAGAVSAGAVSAGAVSVPENAAEQPIPLRPTKASPSANDPERSPWSADGVEDFELTERGGRTVTKADLLGTDWVVCFIFVKCAGPCMNVSGQMYRIQEALSDRDFRLVTITVDPERDTPEELDKYAEAFAADPDKWLFLTGEKDDIYHLIRHSFLMSVAEAEGKARLPGFEIIHTTNILHVDAEGRVRGKYDAQDRDEVDQLIRVLRARLPVTPAGEPAAEEEAD